MDSSVLKLLRDRHASRAISTRPISNEIVDELVEAARLAPSCFNNQPWRYIFMRSDSALAVGREALSAGNATWATRAPLLIACLTRKSDDCVIKDDRAYHQFDLGLSVMNIMLLATERGLTARPMAGFKPEAIRSGFDLGDDDEPFLMLAVGYPDDDESFLPEGKRGMGDKPRSRKQADEIVRIV